jgi:Zn-dependent membrane protease YugP
VLSSANYHGTTPAALGVAAHECGHAIQHKLAYGPLQLRMAAVGITGFASQLVLWIPLVGMFTGLLAAKTGLVIMAAAWGVLMAFNLITLPVEFDASTRARQMLRATALVSTLEYDGASAVLSAAALTYVAALLQAVAQLLYFVLMVLGLGGRRS